MLCSTFTGYLKIINMSLSSGCVVALDYAVDPLDVDRSSSVTFDSSVDE